MILSTDLFFVQSKFGLLFGANKSYILIGHIPKTVPMVYFNYMLNEVLPNHTDNRFQIFQCNNDGMTVVSVKSISQLFGGFV